MRYFFLLFGLFSVSVLYWIFFALPTESTSPLFSSSLSGASSTLAHDGYYHIDAVVELDSPRTAFYFSFPRSEGLIASGVTIRWGTGDSLTLRTLDTEDLDMRGYDSRIYSTPYITRGRSQISFQIVSPSRLTPEDIELISSYSPSRPSPRASSDAYAATRIISRAEWGADESYRYTDTLHHAQPYKEYLRFVQSPKTQEQIDTIQKESKRRKESESLFPDTMTFRQIIRTENGHPLYWPIEKTPTVNRIIIHHTAESLDKEADDLTYIRDIYKYHALTRGWGDIGYNYIIGQRGAIYEGRAGGDYVVGAHTPGNNEGSVGISVIGNFEELHLNRDQRAGLESAISFVAAKYGITLSDTVSAIYSCRFRPTCDHVETHTLSALSGHRDYNPTLCPGKNIYSELPGLIKNLDRPYQARKNTEPIRIDPEPPEEKMNMVLIPPVMSKGPSDTLISSVGKSQKSPKIKIRLSYTGSTVTLDGVTVSSPVARIGARKIPFGQRSQVSIRPGENNTLEITLGGKVYRGPVFSLEGEVVRIASWSRIPTWDSSRNYNDNLFRGKLIVRNQSGKLLIINELPIEDYIKGLGEVSNTDLEQKIKTILISARTYAYYYIDKSHRKYATALYDGSDDPDTFQKYLGYGYEMRSPRVTRFAEDTRGQVITYLGEVIKTWYFSASDGRTFSYQEYCSKNTGKACQDIPYLQSVADPGGVGKVRLGHGVGISGIGATYFAQQGWDYTKIIQYYLKGVEIIKK